MRFDNDEETKICSTGCITPQSKRSHEDFSDLTSTANLHSTEWSTNKAQRRTIAKKEKD